MALKNSFKRPGARTSVIACVSPASKDTEHSLNTLKNACVMAVNDGKAKRANNGSSSSSSSSSEGGSNVTTVQVGEVSGFHFQCKKSVPVTVSSTRHFF